MMVLSGSPYREALEVLAVNALLVSLAILKPGSSNEVLRSGAKDITAEFIRLLDARDDGASWSEHDKNLVKNVCQTLADEIQNERSDIKYRGAMMRSSERAAKIDKLEDAGEEIDYDDPIMHDIKIDQVEVTPDEIEEVAAHQAATIINKRHVISFLQEVVGNITNDHGLP